MPTAKKNQLLLMAAIPLLTWVVTAFVRKMLQRERAYEAQYYHLLLRNRELQETRLQLVKQDETERRTLAADLHDQVLNDLKLVKQRMLHCAEKSDEKERAEVEQLLDQTMDQVRELMDSLCPSVLEHLGLVAAIDDCLRRGAGRANFKTRFKSALTPEQLECLSMVEQSLMFRVAQEAITNVCKHAQASLVKASVQLDEGWLKVIISDDGKGLDPALVNSSSRGLRFMRQRADLIGATIAWHSGDGGKGTVVEIGIDLKGRNGGSRSDN
jgi:signal transduction histidine kinase